MLLGRAMDFGYYLLDGGIKEITPYIFSHLPKLDCRKIFINFYNSCVEQELKIRSAKICENQNLHEIFLQKIGEILQNEDENDCKISKLIIKNYINKDYQSLKKLYPKMPKNKAAKLILMLYGKDEIGLHFNASMLFTNYIYDKISRLHGDENVTFEDGLIILKKNGKEILGVMPSFKYVKMSKPQEMENEIKTAFEILQKRDTQKLFIAFPRNEEFTKHLAVKQYSSDEDTKLTLVPYAITHKSSCNFSKHSK